MKALVLILVLVAGNALAESNLPACGSGSYWKLTNCSGTHTFSNGDNYNGEWRDGKPHGQGTYTHASGAIYKGEWKWDQPHGIGSYTYSNGNQYFGEFREGSRHGYGILRFVDRRSSQEGLWSKNSFVRVERIPDHIVYAQGSDLLLIIERRLQAMQTGARGRMFESSRPDQYLIASQANRKAPLNQ